MFGFSRVIGKSRRRRIRDVFRPDHLPFHVEKVAAIGAHQLNNKLVRTAATMATATSPTIARTRIVSGPKHRLVVLLTGESLLGLIKEVARGL